LFYHGIFCGGGLEWVMEALFYFVLPTSLEDTLFDMVEGILREIVILIVKLKRI
jgi:hypothetical protein